MAVEYTHITDVRGFLSQRGVRNVGPHAFTRKILNWSCCTRCGLLALKNDATRREMKKPCVVYE
jgi:hypothetical protein